MHTNHYSTHRHGHVDDSLLQEQGGQVGRVAIARGLGPEQRPALGVVGVVSVRCAGSPTPAPARAHPGARGPSARRPFGYSQAEALGIKLLASHKVAAGQRGLHTRAAEGGSCDH
eukprot:1159560-Pelagomonas_calceolata.AAC.6